MVVGDKILKHLIKEQKPNDDEDKEYIEDEKDDEEVDDYDTSYIDTTELLEFSHSLGYPKVVLVDFTCDVCTYFGDNVPRNVVMKLRKHITKGKLGRGGKTKKIKKQKQTKHKKRTKSSKPTKNLICSSDSNSSWSMTDKEINPSPRMGGCKSSAV